LSFAVSRKPCTSRSCLQAAGSSGSADFTEFANRGSLYFRQNPCQYDFCVFNSFAHTALHSQDFRTTFFTGFPVEKRRNYRG